MATISSGVRTSNEVPLIVLYSFIFLSLWQPGYNRPKRLKQSRAIPDSTFFAHTGFLAPSLLAAYDKRSSLQGHLPNQQTNPACEGTHDLRRSIKNAGPFLTRLRSPLHSDRLGIVLDICFLSRSGKAQDILSSP